MGRAQIHCTIHRSLKDVFDIYTQSDTWSWSDIREVRWYGGRAWEVESRMHFKPNDSYGVTVDQVLTHFEPYRRIDFISHFGGVTMTSQLVFRALSDSVTELHGQLEFVGTFSRIAGFALGSAIESGARRFYEQLKRECERQVAPGNKVSPSLSNTAKAPNNMKNQNP
jgi:hypothetical protein